MQLAFYTTLSMIFFAANALLCRLALIEVGMNSQSYTIIRAFSAAITLYLVMVFRKKEPLKAGNIKASLALFAYMAPFSLGFMEISAATGTLLTGVSVQASMLVLAYVRKDYVSLRKIIGICIAIVGIIMLFPGGISAGAPPLHSALFMICSGIGWAFYSTYGYASKDPALSTAGNIIWCAPMTLILLPFAELAPLEGIIYAVLAGSGATAFGYIIWYATIAKLSMGTASVVQLSVPLITALGGVIFLSEPFTMRCMLSMAIILSGIALAITSKK
ncbi:MAG: DMT family transporter [Pseudomonadota bacterium]